MRVLAAAICIAVGWTAPAWADCGDELQLEGKLVQSGLVLGRAAPGTRIYLDGVEIRVGPQGRFLFGFGRDHDPAALLWVICPDGGEATLPLSVAPRRYDVQRIDGLPPKFVSSPPALVDRLRAEHERIIAARRIDTAETFFAGGLVWPATGRVTEAFGGQRILNGEPQPPHTGIDIAAPLGTAVHAPAAGIVRLAAEDFLETGGTLVLDHGHGLNSTFFHLQRLRVAEGDRVAQDEVVATVGASGVAKEPHVEWQVGWFERRLDPALLVGSPREQTSSSD